MIGAGLSPTHRIIAPGLRRRARSSKPVTGYEMDDHARKRVAPSADAYLSEIWSAPYLSGVRNDDVTVRDGRYYSCQGTI